MEAVVHDSSPVRDLLDALPEPAMVVSSTSIRIANDRAVRLFGYSGRELEERSVDDVVDTSDRARARALFAQRRGEEELRGVRKDGSELDAQVSVKPLDAATYGAQASLVVVRPGLAITQALTKLLEAVPDAMIVVRADGRIALANGRVEDLFGYSPAELLGRPLEVLLPERYAAGHAALRQEYMRAPDVRAMDLRGRDLFGRRKDGTEFPVDIMLSPWGTEAGAVAIAAVRDATPRKKLEEARLRLALSEEAIRLRDEFVSLVGHELKTPLTSTRLSLDRLLRKSANGALPPDPECVKALTTMSRALGRIERLVEELLDVSTIVSTGLSLQRREVDLAALVRDEVEALDEPLRRAGCRAIVSAPETVVGAWDPKRVRQLVGHLLSNAMRYGPGNPIEVRVARAGREAVLTVRDHGVGIGAEHREKIFERFARFESSRHYAGLGLGLWIVRQVAEAHGGHVGACSDGEGATFTVVLPLT